jgi:hypothetical protein
MRNTRARWQAAKTTTFAGEQVGCATAPQAYFEGNLRSLFPSCGEKNLISINIECRQKALGKLIARQRSAFAGGGRAG